MNKANLKIYLLFLAVLLSWAFNWPAMKYGLHYIAPLWYATFRLGFSTLLLFIFLIARQKLTLPSRKDWPMIFSQGLLQLGIYMSIIIIALHYIGAGKTVILCYATTIWSTPIAVFCFHENVSLKKIIGFILGVIGIIAYFDPTHFNWHDTNVLIGSGFALLGSLTWATAMLFARFGRWHSPPSQLYPWQLLSALVPVGLITLITQPMPHFTWTFPLISALGFSTLFATLFAWWGMIIVARALPSTLVSIGILIVPVIVVFLAALVLNEKINHNMIVALVAIVSGICLVATEKTQKA